ncbi:MAG: hypothetical protein RBS40_00250 [Rhodocyclaceae bacterium]|jgi:hypothetical protein|nr:hypothetical protein [Rhodocyclaceae bacterium]
MTAMTQDRNTPARDGRDFQFPVAASVKIYAGAMVAVTSAGYATKGQTATALKAVGVAQALADNATGAAGAVHVKVRRGCYRLANSTSTDQISLADVGSDCYMVDDQTVAKTSGSNTRSVAGTVRDVDASGVWVEF